MRQGWAKNLRSNGKRKRIMWKGSQKFRMSSGECACPKSLALVSPIRFSISYSGMLRFWSVASNESSVRSRFYSRVIFIPQSGPITMPWLPGHPFFRVSHWFWSSSTLVRSWTGFLCIFVKRYHKSIPDVLISEWTTNSRRFVFYDL